MKNKTAKLSDIVASMKLQVMCGEKILPRVEIEGGYMSDMLSDVIANGRKGDVWITNQLHPNIVAVAVLKEIGSIIIVGGRRPEADTVKKGQAENIVILCSEQPAYEVAGRLYASGITGMR